MTSEESIFIHTQQTTRIRKKSSKLLYYPTYYSIFLDFVFKPILVHLQLFVKHELGFYIYIIMLVIASLPFAAVFGNGYFFQQIFDAIT